MSSEKYEGMLRFSKKFYLGAPLKSDKLDEILWPYAFFYRPQRLVSTMHSPLSQALLNILKEYPEKLVLKEEFFRVLT